MSGIKDQAMTEFYRKLRARGHTVTSLADLMMCGRTHLTLVINGRRSGKQTWRKLALVLTAEEMALLEKVKAERKSAPIGGTYTLTLAGRTSAPIAFDASARVAADVVDSLKVSRETLLRVEH